MVDGPFKFTDESIVRVVSAKTEYSNRSNWRIALMRIQAPLDVTWEVEARDETSQILCQHARSEGLFALGVQAILRTLSQPRSAARNRHIRTLQLLP